MGVHETRPDMRPHRDRAVPDALRLDQHRHYIRVFFIIASISAISRGLLVIHSNPFAVTM